MKIDRNIYKAIIKKNKFSGPKNLPFINLFLIFTNITQKKLGETKNNTLIKLIRIYK